MIEDPMMFQDVLQSLTPSQRQAVHQVDGPLLILAGPGSGKTRVITHRIAHLMHQGIAARQILALTFTNKAADEMRLRLQRLAPDQPVWIGTFHRFCARLLRQYASLVGLQENYSIYDVPDSRKILQQAVQDIRLEATHVTPDGIATAISWAKSNLITAQQYVPHPGHAWGAVVAQVYPAYQRRLLQANAADFDDLLLHVAILLRENPELRSTLDERFRYILVDEYQDTNLAQYAIVRALSVEHPNLAVTGDPDQSIYGWRGANLTNILEFEKDFPAVHVVRLEQNYRSTPGILRVADQLIGYNVKRKQKALYTHNADGPPVRLVIYPTHRDEADGIAARIAQQLQTGQRRPRDVAIFYRINALSRTLEQALSGMGIPYQIVNGVAFYQRKEIKDLLAYLCLLNNPADEVAFLRIVNVPARAIGKTTLERLAEYARHQRLGLLDAARDSRKIGSLNKRAVSALSGFVALYDRLAPLAASPVEEILGHVLTESGYRQYLLDSGTEEDQERLANIEELLTAAREFDEQHPEGGTLEAFLEQSALTNDTDCWEAENDKVTLMTLHAAKGLEFPLVFITALEEGLLPHERSKHSSDQVEEERRLLFVGITRAEQELQLSLAQQRTFRGGQWPTVPSPFLMELPREEMEIVEPALGAGWGPEDQDFGMAQEQAAGDVFPEYELVDQEPGEEAYLQDDPGTAAADTGAKVMTAAQMLDGNRPAANPVHPNQFRLGMLVTHPQYGSGTILALSGEDAKRTATVRFFSAAGEKKFRLAYSPLRPVRST